MRAYQFIVEDADEVGREFQHIEDLTYIQGPQGALKALDRLAQIAKDSSHLEVKWDGSPAIIFGRNDRGEFHLGDKYSNQMLKTPEDIFNYYMRNIDTDKDDPGKFSNRENFAYTMSTLFSVYEQATPKNYRGFLECGLMYPTSQQPKPKAVNGVYTFKPNTVIYHVQANSPLGQRIDGSYTAAAATGFFSEIPGLGGQRQAVGDHYKPINSPSVVIIPPTFTSEQVQVDLRKIQAVKNFVIKNTATINKFITPSPEWVASFKQNPSKASSEWRAVIYKYVNSQVDVAGGLDNLGKNMAQWATTDPILKSAGRREIAIDKINKDQGSLQATFKVVTEIMKLKNLILDQIETPTLAKLGMSATLPTGHQSGEGFVSDPYGGKNPLKLVNRAGFTAANRSQGAIGAAKQGELGAKAKQSLKESEIVDKQSEWKKIMELNRKIYSGEISMDTWLTLVEQHFMKWENKILLENAEQTAVVGWGRGMGHKGHMYLAHAVISYAKKTGADPFFIVSETVGKDDPLMPAEKIKIYQTVFPENKNIFDTARTPIEALEAVYNAGYKNVVFMVGEDQVNSFKFLATPTKSTGKLPVPFDSIKIISRQQSGDKYAKEAGPRATPLRNILKGDATTEQKFQAWRDAMPNALSDEQVLSVMSTAAERMGHKI